MISEDFSTAEAQLLATLFALEARDEDWRGGRRGPITRRRLLEHGELFFDDQLEPWGDAFDTLRDRGLVAQRGGSFHVTLEGRRPAEQLRHDFRRRRFDEMLLRAEESAAYGAFWSRTSDLPFRAFSPLDEGQLTVLLEALALQPEHHLLDAGCGTGRVTEEIVRRRGCRATGLDLASEAVQMARRRTAGMPRLHFETVDLGEALPHGLPDVDAVVAVDSLAFLDDLEAGLHRLAGCLRPGGVLAALCLEIVPRPESGFEELPTAQTLAKLALPYSVIDFTEPCAVILRARRFAARALAPRFRREGSSRLARALAREGDRLAPHVEAGTLRRLLYRVGPIPPPPGRAARRTGGAASSGSR